MADAAPVLESKSTRKFYFSLIRIYSGDPFQSHFIITVKVGLLMSGDFTGGFNSAITWMVSGNQEVADCSIQSQCRTD